MILRCSASAAPNTLRTLLTAALLLPTAGALPAQTANPLPHRVFATSRFAIDKILARPYDRNVPFGASGDLVWATSPQGWGFREGVQLLYVTNLNTFDVIINGNGKNYVVEKADYFPSHVHSVGAVGAPLRASASFTYTTDNMENPLTKPFEPAKRWTCWSSGRREDWFEVDFGKTRRLGGLDLYFFDDQPNGGCAPPESVRVELFRNGKWNDVPARPLTPVPGKNTIIFSGFAPEQGERLRLTFRNRGENLYTGLYGLDPAFADTKPTPAGANPKSTGRTTQNLITRIPEDLIVTGDKWITQNDVLVSRITVRNPGKTKQPLFLRMDSPLSGTMRGFADERQVEGYPLYLVAAGTDGKERNTTFLTELAPGQSRSFTFACAGGHTKTEAGSKLNKALADANPLKSQTAAYQGWFDSNIARFACSDPLIEKMYYHRWYNVKKNSMNPHLGALKHRAFSEGRWTSDWYANVISYGAGHQIRESRWLRDPSYAWGHLQTWTENERPDGIFPSHITPKGQQGGQYTDWIGSTAWDAYLVHPDKRLLAKVADPVARNAEGWKKVYGWNDSPLLVVDSHWWTGMEWQPSFFSFSDYQTGGGAGTAPDKMTPLSRVDLTAYNFGNAQNSARIYSALGRTADAARMRQLADATRDAVLKEMWNPETNWFQSLRASDEAKAPAKEIIGLYPFYFDLPPAGKGYEAAWKTALDPDLFWTKWPLASAAKDCPAYSQTGWPVGPGGSGCMWNGPSWPHANSIVLTAMANTLRHYEHGVLSKEKLYDLFASFTRVQYKDQDRRIPWTGEFYDGDDGKWKTDQRDYNHSTWIDPLISDLIGIVPRNDDVLEIDPLVPKEAWSWYVLDGQSYRGHDITIAYDKTGSHIAPGFKGYAVYLDGKLIEHTSRPKHVLFDMGAHKLRGNPVTVDHWDRILRPRTIAGPKR